MLKLFTAASCFGFAKYFGQFILKFETVQAFSDDLSIRVDQEIRRDTAHGIKVSFFTFPEMQVGYLCPGKLILVDSIQPFLFAIFPV
jgi:hypothetical protein